MHHRRRRSRRSGGRRACGRTRRGGGGRRGRTDRAHGAPASSRERRHVLLQAIERRRAAGRHRRAMRHVVAPAGRAQRIELRLARLLRQRVARGAKRRRNQHGGPHTLQPGNLEHHGHRTPLRRPSPENILAARLTRSKGGSKLPINVRFQRPLSEAEPTWPLRAIHCLLAPMRSSSSSMSPSGPWLTFRFALHLSAFSRHDFLLLTQSGTPRPVLSPRKSWP